MDDLVTDSHSTDYSSAVMTPYYTTIYCMPYTILHSYILNYITIYCILYTVLHILYYFTICTVLCIACSIIFISTCGPSCIVTQTGTGTYKRINGSNLQQVLYDVALRCITSYFPEEKSDRLELSGAIDDDGLLRPGPDLSVTVRSQLSYDRWPLFPGAAMRSFVSRWSYSSYD